MYTLFVCVFVSNKHSEGQTDFAQIFVGPHVAPGMVYEWSKVKVCHHQNLIFIKFSKILQVHEFF